jgi:hypothetical protein
VRYFVLLTGQTPTGLLRHYSGITEQLTGNCAWDPGGSEFIFTENAIDATEVSAEEAALVAASLGCKGAV